MSRYIKPVVHNLLFIPLRILDAFEPSVFNLALLVKNISINGLASKTRIVPPPLSSADGFGDFTLQMTTEGGALSSFDVAYGQDGKPLNKVLSYITLKTGTALAIVAQ